MSDDRVMDLFYPPDWRCAKNPLWSGLREQSTRWAIEVGFDGDCEELANKPGSYAVESPLFISWLYSTTPNPAFLQLMSDYTVWVLFVDDYVVEEALRADDGRRQAMLSTFSTKLERAPSSTEPLERGFHDLVRRFRDISGGERRPEWMERFDESWVECFRSIVFEETKALTAWQGRAFYEAQRPAYSFDVTYIHPVEVAYDCYLPPRVARDARIRRLHSVAALGCGLANDAISAAREKPVDGAPSQNYVFMHMHEQGCGEVEALRATVAWHNECVRECVRLGDEIVRAFGGEHPQIDTYVRGVYNVFRGHTEWTRTTARYGRLAGCEFRIVPQG